VSVWRIGTGGCRLFRAVVAAITLWPALALAQPTPLDRWIVQRFRGAQLVPDSQPAQGVGARPVAPVARVSAAPRIEQTRRGATRDTLWAVHFAAGPELAGLAVGTRTTLTGPTGTMTPVVARVVARRPFRAPRSPGSALRPDSSWRHAWAYLVVMPHLNETAISRYRGWLLVETPDPVPAR
jgi:hypothetical protein